MKNLFRFHRNVNSRKPNFLAAKNVNMEENNTALIVIDVQEKLVKAIPDIDSCLVNIGKMIDCFRVLKMKFYITEQSPNKLGATVNNLKLEDNCIRHAKVSFSCIECTKIINELKNKNIFNVLICGIETHVCVLQSSLDLLRAGFQVYIISDAVKSRKENDNLVALKRLSTSGGIITTTETLIFELCKTSKRPEFKPISEIIKRSN